VVRVDPRPNGGVPLLRVSEVGEFVRHRSCERRFKLESDRRRLARRLPFYERLFNTLDVVLQARGREREDDWAVSLDEQGLADLVGGRPEDEDSEYPDWEQFADAVRACAVGQRGYAREVRLSGQIGIFEVHGRADFLVLTWPNGCPTIRIVECKSSRRDRTYQRMQVAAYRILIRQLLANDPIEIAGHRIGPDQVEAVVARVDESTNENQDILQLEPLDLDMEEADLRRLTAPDGALAHIVDTDLDDLGYQIDAKCDGCVFNVDCLPESARQRRHELIGLSVSSAGALRRAGIATLDDLADLDLDGEQARAARADPALTESLERLVTLARARRTTLPPLAAQLDPHAAQQAPGADDYPVQAIPDQGSSQIPPHEQDGERLIRVYLSVDYDYTENRVGALSAHITASTSQISTGWVDTGHRRPDGRPEWRPDPMVHELQEPEPGLRPQRVRRPLSGRDVVEVKGSEWSGRYDEDTGAEREIIQNFLLELIEAIAEIAGEPDLGGSGDGMARIHFYVWSRAEMTQLVEGCSRAESRLLGALRELLGCREGLEQMIYSCVQDEVDQRYALGWTGRGLGVVTSLGWFGQTYHWTRRVAGADVRLDDVFTQDIFDFKTTLDLTPGGQWARPRDASARPYRFEIRSRFNDNLPAPYWRALWQSLPDPNGPGITPQVARSIRRYDQAGRPGMLRSYLKARTHALRWVEERIRFKNNEIVKPRLAVDELRRFTLGVNDASAAAVDFLRLDHAVDLTDWISRHLRSVRTRMATGRTLPVRDIVQLDDGLMIAELDLDRYELSAAELQSRAAIGVGSFVRISPHGGQPQRGQTIGQLLRGGRTCRVEMLDWASGRIELQLIPGRLGRYVLQSFGFEIGPVWDYATIDESPSDFVAGRVDARLTSGRGLYAAQWFDPLNPQVPDQTALPGDLLEAIRTACESADLGAGIRLSQDQVEAVIAGLGSRVQLLQGPPGTGKTQTTATSVLARTAARLQPGALVLIAANTHTAVDTLARRICEVERPIREAMEAVGVALPPVQIARVHSSSVDNPIAPLGIDILAAPSATRITTLRAGAVLILAGTTGTLLKMVRELDGKQPWSQGVGFQADMLIVDEASMMVFPHFLALATCLNPAGEVLTAGDHRQLSPILAHDWENEDRPPAVTYQPFASAYNAIREIAEHRGIGPAAVWRSALELTFRLPPPIVELISRLYLLDDIELRGVRDAAAEAVREPGGVVVAPGDNPAAASLGAAWAEGAGLYLVLHDERDSRQSNRFEAELIRELLQQADPALDDGSVAVLTPHRAQRSMLSDQLRDQPAVDIIDTVERLQGGERLVVVVSGTASEPNAIAKSAEFLLDLNRSNVAFSRCRERLIVVCSRSLLDHIPADLENYQAALLWKSLRALCTRLVGSAVLTGHQVQVLTLPQPPAAGGRNRR
jgi:AAA domain